MSRYPIGPMPARDATTAEERAAWIREIAAAPALLRQAVSGLDEAQLDTPYREGGWTLRQVVHHVPDSHMNAYVRMKLALTEDRPTIKPYDEARWAELADSRGPVEGSLVLLDRLHERWVRLWEALDEAQFARTLMHPEIGAVRLDQMLASYAWHGRHHTAHITSLRTRMGW